MIKAFEIQTSVGTLSVPSGEVPEVFAQNLGRLQPEALTETLWNLAEEISERQDRVTYLAGVTAAMRANRAQWDETAMDALEDALANGDK